METREIPVLFFERGLFSFSKRKKKKRKEKKKGFGKVGKTSLLQFHY